MPSITRQARVRSFIRIAVMVGGAAAAWSSRVQAGEAVVSVPECSVRSAPFEVAPEVARLHAGDKLTADDQAQGAWRRVKLPDGRFGLVHDRDLQVTVAPAAAAAAAAAAAPAP